MWHLLYLFVFQPSNEGFYNCLDIWTTFLDYLLTKSKGREQDLQAVILRFSQFLIHLVYTLNT